MIYRKITEEDNDNILQLEEGKLPVIIQLSRFRNKLAQIQVNRTKLDEEEQATLDKIEEITIAIS